MTTKTNWQKLHRDIQESDERMASIVKEHSRNEFPYGRYAGYPTDASGVSHFPANIYLVNILDRVYSGGSLEDATSSLVLVWKNKAGLQSKEVVKANIIGERYESAYSPWLRTYNAEEIIESFNTYGRVLERGDWGIKEFKDTSKGVFISYGVRDSYQEVLDQTLKKFRISKKEMGLS